MANSEHRDAVPFGEPTWYSRQSSPYYNESHERVRAAVRAYVAEKITPNCAEWEAAGAVPKEVLTDYSSRGFTALTLDPASIVDYLEGITLPGDVKASDWDAFHDLIFIDEIARCGYLGIIWALGCGDSIGCPPLVNFGTDEQKQRFLPSVIRGESRFCLGVTEPDAGSDVAGIMTVAKRKGDVYVVNGTKKWITNGMWATHCTAAVRTGGPGKRGISALIIPLTGKGVSRRKILNSGVAASGSAYLEFDDVEVPVSNLLGKENEGFKIIMSSKLHRCTVIRIIYPSKLDTTTDLFAIDFNHERLWLACTSLRMARECMADAYSHALTRKTFGKHLIDHQAIRTKFSTVALGILPVHAFMESLVAMAHAQTVKRKQHKSNETLEELRYGGLIALLKVAAGRALETAVRESQQIMGGLGYSRTGKGERIEQISRDVRVMVVGGGSEEILSDLAFSQERRDLQAIGRESRL